MKRLAEGFGCEGNVFEQKRKKVFFTVLILLGAFRFSYLGYEYTPYLDDYVQYMLYPGLENGWERVMVGGAGVLFIRPLAGLADFFVWSRFGEAPGIAVLIISVLYSLSAVFFYGAFCRAGIKISPLFLIIYVFFPLNIEGTYWLSASSRIAVSLFLVSICCRLLVSNKLTGFAVFNAASMCFYEQTAMLAVAVPLMLCFWERDRRYKGVLTAVLVNISLLGVYYLVFGRLSNNSARMWVRPAMLAARIGKVTEEGLDMWLGAGVRLMLNGFGRGFRRIAEDGEVWWVLCLILLALLLCATAPEIRSEKTDSVKKICFGVLLAVVPLFPFVIGSGQLNFRNAVPSLPGVALMLDGILPVLLKKRLPLLMCLCTVFFSVVSVSEICDYDLTAKRDMEIINMAAESIPEEVGIDFEEVVCVCDAPVRFGQNTDFNDHMISIRGSGWGITGPVKAMIVMKNK